MLLRPLKEQHDKNELFRMRSMLILAAGGNVLWGALSQIYYPEGYDPIFIRLITTSLLFIYLFASYRIKINPLSHDAIILLTSWTIGSVGMLHIYYNDWALHHVIGTLTTASVAYTLFWKKTSVLIHTTLLITLFTAVTIMHPGVSHLPLHLAWTLAVVIAGILSGALLNELVQQLLATENKSATILSNMQEGLVMHLPGGQITLCNSSAGKILGLSTDQILGKTNVDPQWKTFTEDGKILLPEDHPSAMAEKQQHSVRNFPMVVQKPDGSEAHIRINAEPVFDSENKKLESVIVTFLDVTEERLAQRKIEEQQVSLANNSKLTALGEMASGIAHEINNPLAILFIKLSQMSTELNSPTYTKESLQDSIASMQKTCERIKNIVLGMRALSRDGSSDLFEECNVQQAIDDAVAVLREKLASESIQLQINCHPNLKVFTRPNQLSQVILNLIHNAYDAIRDYSGERWIKIEANAKGEQIIIETTDSGPGIAAEVRQKIMRPFFTTKAPGQGTGLGLSISKNIIQSHGGTLEYDPSSRHTKFSISLPARNAFRSTGASNK